MSNDADGMPAAVPTTGHMNTASTGRPLRVLLDMPGVGNAAWGGMQEHVLILGSALRQAGWAPLLHAHTHYAATHERRLANAGIPVLRAPGLQAVGAGWWPTWSYVLALRELLRREHVGLYHLHSALMGHEPQSLLAARMAHIPTIMTYHCTPWGESPQRRLGMIATHRVAPTPIIAVSRAVAEMARDKYRVPAHDISVIYNGLPDLPFDESVTPLYRRADDVLIGVVARLERVKGIDVLLDALARLDPALPYRVIIVGEGSERESLEAQTRRLGLSKQVEFIGFRPDVRHLMHQWDLVVMPSRAGEGLPLTAIETFAARRPIVATRIGGLPEIVRDGETGWLVPHDDVGALAQALTQAILRPDLRARRGDAGRERFMADLRVDAMVGKTTALYQRALDAHPGHASPLSRGRYTHADDANVPRIRSDVVVSTTRQKGNTE